jgi:hypothetical protein
MPTSFQPPETPKSESTEGEHSTQSRSLGLYEVSKLAELLDSKDQVRLIARLLESMPPKYRAAIIEFGLQGPRTAAGDKPGIRAVSQRVNPPGPTLWERLFDPTKTSELYSAPRRFDLATIFVVTAAYSLLFGSMTALDYYFGAPTKVAVGLLVTLVAVSQAYFQHIANPRGVSIITGSIALSVILALMKIIERSWVPEPLVVVVVFYGMIGGAIAGYLSGVLVGGVFLVADLLRAKFDDRSNAELNESSTDDLD